MITFTSIEVGTWRQFSSITLKLHRRLTVLTGANGAGKTTILNLLSSHFGWQPQFVSTPKLLEQRRQKGDAVKGLSGGQMQYRSDFWFGLSPPAPPPTDPAFWGWAADFKKEPDPVAESDLELGWSRLLDEQERAANTQRARMGTIRYSDNGEAALEVPIRDVGPHYQVRIADARKVRGLHVPSHRPVYAYQEVQQLPLAPRGVQQFAEDYSTNVRQWAAAQPTGRTSNFIIKSNLMALAMFGYGNNIVEGNSEYRHAFEGFQSVLRTVLPSSLGFRKLSIRPPEVVLITASGDFSLDAVSGGVASIIDLSWQIFTFGDRTEPFVVTIDEPENHLHPELQRQLLPSLLKAFPNVQFIVASHNPFIVSSVPESSVYVLGYDENRRVRSTLLDRVNKAGSANDILREALGVPVSQPIWVEHRLQYILNRYQGRPLTKDTLRELKTELRALNLDEYVPDAINVMTDSPSSKPSP